MKEVDIILFDLDGTLVASREDITDAINDALRHFGFKEKSVSEVSSYVGTGVDDLVRKSLGIKNNDSLVKEVTEYFKGQRRDDKSILYPNVRDILKYFESKILAVVTNREHEFAKATLEAMGVNGYFSDVLGADSLSCKKPSPMPVDTLLKKYGIKKEKAIIIGDMYIDILTGKNAGIATCAVTYGLGQKEDILKLQPDYVIDDIIELKGILK